MSRRLLVALRRFEGSLWGDALGVVCLFGMLALGLFFAAVLE